MTEGKDAGPSPPAGQASQRSTEISGRRRILVVEDEALIAMETASILLSAKFEILGPASTVAQALELLERSDCDAAVLDVNLGKETAEPVARYLSEKGTPFITMSGYTREQMPTIFRDSLLLSKPLRSDLLIEAVRQCLAPRNELGTL
ncbi:MAG: response regulator [Rhodomicrobium sp.]